MADTSPSRRILLVAEKHPQYNDGKWIEYDSNAKLISAFNAAKAENFKGWGRLNAETLAVLNSMELQPRDNHREHNEQTGRFSDSMTPIIQDVMTAIKKNTPFSGIIAKKIMPASQRVTNAEFTSVPTPRWGESQPFHEHHDAINSVEGGLELAKIANDIQIPVVIHSQKTEPSYFSMNSLNPALKHLLHRKPAKTTFYNDDDAKGIFVGLAKEIIASEKKQAATMSR